MIKRLIHLKEKIISLKAHIVLSLVCNYFLCRLRDECIYLLVYVLGHMVYKDAVLWHQYWEEWESSCSGVEFLYVIEVKLV